MSKDHRPTVNRRSMLAGFGVLPALGGRAAAAVASPRRDPSFIAIGDWGRRGAGPQAQVARAMGRVAADIDSRFTLAVGDNFYPAGVASVKDSHWQESFEKVYTHAALQRPWYAALGNHDYRGNPYAQIDYTRQSHRWRMPSHYYKVPASVSGIPGLDIFVLDTASLVTVVHEFGEQMMRGHFWREDRGAQLKWFERELAKSTAPWKVVVGHHPIFSGAHGNDDELIASVKPLLERYGVQAYINGHDHDLQHIVVGGVSYVCSGAGSECGRVKAIDGTRYCVSKSGFAQFTLKADALALTFRDLNGASLYQADIPRVTKVASRNFRKA